jgi:hypothetical protein
MRRWHGQQRGQTHCRGEPRLTMYGHGDGGNFG